MGTMTPRERATTPQERVEGERLRLNHNLAWMEKHIQSITLALRMNVPLGSEVGQGIVQCALNVALAIARHDAFLLIKECDTEGESK
jgi:hypothetical protein